MLSANSSAFDGKAAARAAAAWTVSALILLVIASAVINAAGCGEYIMGYVCSALSFLSAFSAGAAAAGADPTETEVEMAVPVDTGMPGTATDNTKMTV